MQGMKPHRLATSCVCATPGCERPFTRPAQGNPSRYCPGCQAERYRARKAQWALDHGKGHPRVGLGAQVQRVTAEPKERFEPATPCRCQCPVPYREATILFCRMCSRRIERKETA